jgi:hypothetical protein
MRRKSAIAEILKSDPRTLMPDTDSQNSLGIVAWNCLFTLPKGLARALPDQVVFTILPHLPPFNANLSHLPFDGVASQIKTVSPHGMPRVSRTIDRCVVLSNLLHLWTLFSITLGTI